MRIGKLARTYGLTVQEVLSYLEEKNPGLHYHPNHKLDEEIKQQLMTHFQLEEVENETDQHEAIDSIGIEEQIVTEENHEIEEAQKIKDKVAEEPVKKDLPSTPEEEIAALDGELAPSEEREEASIRLKLEKEEIRKLPKEDEVIQTDKLLELLESEDSPDDLDRIKLIKAPKRELAGLKVVGKVDLPEPKEIIKEKEEEKPVKNANKRNQIGEEEKEKRRLKAKAKKEAYEARQERRKKEQEFKEIKARKAAHYQEKLVKTPNKSEKKIPYPNETPKEKSTLKSQPPKTLLGKFLRWLNT